MEAAGEELTQCRDLFYVGYLHQCEQLAASLRTSSEVDAVTLEAAQLQFLCRLVNNELTEGELPGLSEATPSLRAIGLFHVFNRKESSEEERTQALTTLKAQVASDPGLSRFLTAAALAWSNTLGAALEQAESTTLEMRALRVYLLLLLNRIDLAEQALAEMTSLNDDAAVTKLASAWVHLAVGNHQEAYLTYLDIQRQCCETEDQEGKGSLQLLNGRAVAGLLRKQWPEANEDLQRALQQAPQSADTIANAICCAQNRRQPSEAQSLYATLSAVAPDHPMVTKSNQIAQAFAAFKEANPLPA